MKKNINGQYYLLKIFLNSKYQENKKNDFVINLFKKMMFMATLVFVFAIRSFAGPMTNKPASNNVNSRVIKNAKRMLKSEEAIPVLTKDQFKIDFPKATQVKWTTFDEFYEANFISGTSKMSTFFDYNDTMVGTGKYISFNKLPAKGIESVNKFFKDYSPEVVMYYDDNELNPNDLYHFGVPLDKDAYYALMKDNNSNKEIVVQITLDGEASYFSAVR
jgi:hypothetical protein